MTGSGQGWAYVESTGCFAWTGKTGRGGRPVIYKDGQQTPAARAQWERLYGPLPGRIQLAAVCGRMDCVSPYHHALRRPDTALVPIGITAKAVARLARTLEELAERNPSLPICWKGPLAHICLPPEEVTRLATVLRCETLFIHAAFAKLAKATAEEVATDPTPPLSVGDVMASLDKLRLAAGLPLETP